LGLGVAWVQRGGPTEVSGRMPFVAYGEVCQSKLVMCFGVVGRHLNCIFEFKNGAIVLLLREMALTQIQKSIDGIASAAKRNN
jgi:hypothetical protein